MFRTMIHSICALALVCLAGSAQAATGRTTDTTYKTANSAALHTAAYYLNKSPSAKLLLTNSASGKIATNRLRVEKMRLTANGKRIQVWTKRELTPSLPLIQSTVTVKKVGKVWKGFTGGNGHIVFGALAY